MPDYNLKEVKALKYKKPEVVNGYTDQTLYLNLSDRNVTINPVADKTKKTTYKSQETPATEVFF